MQKRQNLKKKKKIEKMGQMLTYFKRKDTQRISFDELAKDISQAKYVVVLTGAGVSAESGIPTFRDPGDGLWEKYDPSVYATIWGFWRHPEKIWELLRDFLSQYDPLPNNSHLAIARLEQLGYVKAVITQNVDNLHQDAGSRNVVEFHGSLMKASCYRCGAKVELTKEIMKDQYFTSALPPKCSCGGVFKPDAILIGERIPSENCRKANAEAKKCDLMLVVGTSASIHPANDLPYTAMANGAKVIEVNLEPTGLTNRISDKIVIGKSSGLKRTVTLLEPSTT